MKPTPVLSARLAVAAVALMASPALGVEFLQPASIPLGNSTTVGAHLQGDDPPPANNGIIPDANWHEAPPLGPISRHAAAYDPSRQYLWIFGGSRRDAPNNEVWVYDLSSGVTVSREISVAGNRPAPRNSPALFYDAAQDRLIMLSGVGPGHELWILSLSGAPQWSQLVPTGTGPSMRSGTLIVFDSTRDQILVFGGLDGTSTSLNDVWALSLDSAPAWTQIVPMGPPPGPRSGHSGVYDLAGDRLIIVGGQQGASTLSDTWALSLSSPAWTLLNASGASGTGFKSVFDPNNNRIIRFGGPSPCPNGSTQSLTLVPPYSWTSEASFPIRTGFATDYDPIMDRVLVHGGVSLSSVCGGSTTPVYFDQLLAGPNWTVLPPPFVVRPSPRMRPIMAYVPARQEAIVVGGQSHYGSLSDVWRLDLSSTPVWQQLSVTGAGQSNTFGTSMIYDPVRDRMLQFGGGHYAATPTADVYSLALQPSPAWQPISVSGTPPPVRAYHSAIYDPVGDRMIVFGGTRIASPWPFPSPDTLYDDVWQLTLSPPMTWSQIIPQGTPPPARFEHSAIYDPARERMVLFGGTAGGSIVDTWELSLGASPTWSEIFTLGPLPTIGRRENHAIYAVNHDCLVIFDGSSTFVLNFSGVPTWSTLPNMTAVAYPGRSYTGTLYDPGRDRMIAYAGYMSGPTCGPCGIEAWADLWTLNFAPGPLSVEPGIIDRATIALRAYPNPSASNTTLEFSLPNKRDATVRIYDVSGRLVRDMFTGSLPAGVHRDQWDGRDGGGNPVMPGLYFVRARMGDVEYRRTIVRTR